LVPCRPADLLRLFDLQVASCSQLNALLEVLKMVSRAQEHICYRAGCATTIVRTMWMMQKPCSSCWPLAQFAGRAATEASAAFNALGVVATADDETVL
jgi:hypothetical protein